MQFHKLKLENIGNHTSLVCNFTGHSLFAIVGKTRAGKSTIMESLFFALTRTTHKMGGQATLGNAIHTLKKLGTTQASIQLTFSIDGIQYCVRRAGNTSTLTGGGLKLDGHNKVNKQILSLLKLTTEQLRYILFLGQGNVDSFLSAAHARVAEIVVQDILNTKILVRMQTDLNLQESNLTAQKNQIEGAIGKIQSDIQGIQEQRNALPNFSPSFFLPFKGKREPWLSCSEEIQKQVSDILREIVVLEKKQKQLQNQLENDVQEVIPLEILQKMEQIYLKRNMILQELKLQIYQTKQLKLQQKRELQELLSGLTQQKLSIQTLKDDQREWQERQQKIQDISQAIETDEQKLAELKKQESSQKEEYRKGEHSVQQQKSKITKSSSEIKKLEQKIDALRRSIKNSLDKIVEINKGIQVKTQHLVSEQSKLLDRCVQYVQWNISEHDKETCPVCEQKLVATSSVSHSDNSPTARDFSNIKKLQKELSQLETDLNQQNGNLKSFREQKSAIEQQITSAQGSLKQEKEMLAELEAILERKKKDFEQFTTEVQKQASAVAEKKRIRATWSKKKSLYTWLQSEAAGIFQSLKTFLRHSSEWKELVSSLTVDACLVLFQEGYPVSLNNLSASFEQRLKIEIEKHYSNQSEVFDAIEDLKNRIVEKRKELEVFWQKFVLSNPEWSNLINPSTLESKQWEELKKALDLFQQSRGNGADLQGKQAKLGELVRKIDTISRIAGHFRAGKKSFREFLAAQLYKELCSLSNPFLQTFLGGTCFVSYQNGFFFEQNGQKLSVKALSGGERFYVSLALAFGLREYLMQKANVKLKTIFIDEGFHMVKGNAIADLLQKLEQLSQDNNIGFITHNEDLIKQTPEKLMVSLNSAVWSE